MWTKSARFLATIGLGLLLAGCGSDDDAGQPALSLVEQLEAVGLGKYLGRPLPDPTSDGDWMRYDFASSDEGPICLRGTPYEVYVRPGSINKVLFYLEGGGACWNDETCNGNTGLGAKEEAEPLAPLGLLQGVLAASAPTNPFAGWHTLYVPYCDGSVFSGDNVVDYANGRVFHRGISNLSTALDVMRENFPTPDEIVVSGSSAGGFGTFPGYGVMRVAYPEAPIRVLNDSGPGLQNNDDPQAVDERRANWLFEQFIVDGCTRCVEQPAFLTDWAIDNDPQLRTALFSYQRDFVISDFLGLERTDYRDLLFDVSGEINALHPDRFKRFLVDGESHTILLGFGVAPGFEIGVEGTFVTLEIDGIGLPEWIADFLADGPDWQDLIEPASDEAG